MSETFEHDELAHRLVTALDALPVSPSPSGLAISSERPRLSDRRALALAAVLIVVAVAFASPQVRQAATELTRYLERLFAPGWSGYYLELGADPTGQVVQRLLFVSSGSTNRTTPDIVGPSADRGPWSPDRERTVIFNGGKIFVGDRRGNVRDVADLGAGRTVVRAGWVDNDRVFAVARVPEGGAKLAIVTLSTGAIDVRTLAAQVSADDAVQFISPDGRWLPFRTRGQAGCASPMVVYDLSADRVLPVLDASGQPAFLSQQAFLSDGRLVIGACDRAAGRLSVEVGAPGQQPAVIATLPLEEGVAPVITIDRAHDEILVINQTGTTSARTIPVFDPEGRLLRTLSQPQLTVLGDRGVVVQTTISSDQRYLSFTLQEIRGSVSILKAAVVDLTNGNVTYLCNEGCARLQLR